jgi:hypothetical protein
MFAAICGKPVRDGDAVASVDVAEDERIAFLRDGDIPHGDAGAKLQGIDAAIPLRFKDGVVAVAGVEDKLRYLRRRRVVTSVSNQVSLPLPPKSISLLAPPFKVSSPACPTTR